MTYKTLKELFADKSRWTQGAYAANDNDDDFAESDIHNEKATCWCLVGGIYKIHPELSTLTDEAYETIEHKKILDIIKREYSEVYCLLGFNDSYSYEEVYAVVCEADV